jgi:hypothetical protein
VCARAQPLYTQFYGFLFTGILGNTTNSGSSIAVSETKDYKHAVKPSIMCCGSEEGATVSGEQTSPDELTVATASSSKAHRALETDMDDDGCRYTNVIDDLLQDETWSYVSKNTAQPVPLSGSDISSLTAATHGVEDFIAATSDSRTAQSSEATPQCTTGDACKVSRVKSRFPHVPSNNHTA